MNTMIMILTFVLIAGILGCLALIIYSLSRPSRPSGKCPAFPVRRLLDEEEMALYGDLATVCEKMELRFSAKVAVASFLELPDKKSDSWAHQLRGEAVDFLLFEKEAERPALALFMERGDASTEQRRSGAIAALEAAGVPHILLRSYNLPGLEKAIREKVRPGAGGGRRGRRGKYEQQAETPPQDGQPQPEPIADA